MNLAPWEQQFPFTIIASDDKQLHPGVYWDKESGPL